jgi:deoxycytidylate deaminase
MKATGKKLHFFEEAYYCIDDSHSRKQCHGAVLVKGGKILSRGKNHISNRVMKKNVFTIHAEVDCFHHLPKWDVLNKGVDIYIVRKMVDGVGMSKPCKHCLDILQKYNIRRIYYTVYSDETDIYYHMERSRDMISNHMSYGVEQYMKANRISTLNL